MHINSNFKFFKIINFLSLKDAPLKNPEYIVMLNKYYSSALMFEFSINNRDMDFINKITEV